LKTKFYGHDVWPKITRVVKKARHNFAAVAYLGKGASTLLPLKENDVLVVDMSEGAVKSGQTNPAEIVKLLRRGVNVYSVENLHAKVFVADGRAFIGSANASSRSANNLVEAVVETTERAAVSGCKSFIKGLRGVPVGPAYAYRMLKLYRPPRIVGGGGQRKVTRKLAVGERLWAVPLETLKWDPEDYEAQKAGKPKARKKISDSRRFIIEEFCWDCGPFVKNVRYKDVTLQIVESGDKRMVRPPARVIHVQRYRCGQSLRAIVFLEMERHRNSKDLRIVWDRLGRQANILLTKHNARLVRDVALKSAICGLWTS
jgi:hypothetical protein